MRAILFRTEIPLTEEIMNLIQDSLLTNSLDVIAENTKVIPTTNIMSAYIYGHYAEQRHMYKKILSSMTSELLTMFNASASDTVADVGKYLEVIARGMMNMRLQTSYEVSNKEKSAMEFTVLKLLQLDEILIGASPNLRRRLNSKLVISPTSYAAKHKLTLGPSRSSTRSNKAGYEESKLMYQSMFFADMNVKFWLDEEIVEIFPSKGECFNAGWLLPQSGAPTKPFALLLECASRDIDVVEETQTTGPIRRGDLPVEGKQTEYFRNTIASAKGEIDAGNITLTPGSLLEALVEGRYLYVYLDTSDEYDSITVGDNVLLMRSTDSKRYLSFYYDFFRLLREGAMPEEAGLA